MDRYWRDFEYKESLHDGESQVALVHLSSDFSQKVVKVARDTEDMRREVTVQQNLSFKNLSVVNLCTFFAQDGWIYAVMDYAPGGSLSTFINGLSQPLPNEEFLTLIYRLLSAVESLHSAGWIHGCINADNFVRDKDDEWKLVDFGKARKIRKTENVTIDNPQRATKLSTRPERHFAEDIWWLGLTCFWAGSRNSTILQKPPRGQNWLLDKYVEDTLKCFYEDQTVWIVRQMLNLNESERGSLSYLRKIIKSMIEVPQSLQAEYETGKLVCAVCTQEIPTEVCVQLPCRDLTCFSCFSDTVSRQVHLAQSAQDVKCAKCKSEIGCDSLIRYASCFQPLTKVKVYNLIYLQFTSRCPVEDCTGRVKVYKLIRESLGLKAHRAECPKCRQLFCSLCREKGGHVLNGYSQVCPEFDPRTLLSLIDS